MQRLEVSSAVRPIYGSLGVKRLMVWTGTLFCAQSFSVHTGKLCDLIQSWVSFFHLISWLWRKITC